MPRSILNYLRIPVYLSKLRRLHHELYLSEKEIRIIQENRLKFLLNHAYSNVEYYKGLFHKAGLKPVDIKTLDDFKRFPITNRADLQKQNTSEIVSKKTDISKCVNFHTSGSTGLPLNIFIDTNEARVRDLFNFMLASENGCLLTDKILHIISKRHFQEKKLCSYFGLLRYSYISARSSPESVLERIRVFKPTIIKGFASCILDLALLIDKRSDNISIKQIITVGEALEGRERDFIKRIFNAEVLDSYSSNECGLIAGECRLHTGLHVNSSNLIFEIVDENENSLVGKEGDIVLTSLSAYAMPFIRYKIGDRGILSIKKCSCGRGPVILEKIMGRQVDFISLPSGITNLYHPLNLIMSSFPGIVKYQIYQYDELNIKLLIVKNDFFNMKDIDIIMDKCSILFGLEVKLNYEFVPEILKSHSGKFKTIISNINPFKL